MNAFTRAESRRGFLKRCFGLAAGTSASLIVGDEVFEILDRLAPRLAMVNGYDTAAVVVLDHWREVRFMLSDAEMYGIRQAAKALAKRIDDDIVQHYTRQPIANFIAVGP